jgi:4-aminobutyrate aminotransferase-like enzyme
MDANVLRVQPPLVISESDLETTIATIDRAIGETSQA